MEHAAAPDCGAIGSLGFDSLGASDEGLVERLCEMAAALRAPERLQRTPAQVRGYFEACRARMRPNPFHNWNHAADVAQFAFLLLHRTGLDRCLCDEQVLGLFFGAVGHDMDHRGKSNAYEINEKTELALRHKGAAPLEAHHTELALAALAESELLDGLPAERAELTRSVVRDVIDATDMGQHTEILRECKAAFRALEELPRTFFSVSPFGGDEPARLLLKLLIKGADISNPSRPAAVAERWNERCYEEFYAEGDADRAKQRKLNPLHDRESNVIPRSSVGFIGFVVTPLFKELRKFLRAAAKMEGGEALDAAVAAEILQGLEANKQLHAERAAALAAVPAPKAASDDAPSPLEDPRVDCVAAEAGDLGVGGSPRGGEAGERKLFAPTGVAGETAVVTTLVAAEPAPEPKPEAGAETQAEAEPVQPEETAGEEPAATAAAGDALGAPPDEAAPRPTEPSTDT